MFTEIATCENDITCKKCKEFEEEYDKVNNGFEAFETLLNMTVVNVFLLEENRNECMVSKLVYKIKGTRKRVSYSGRNLLCLIFGSVTCVQLFILGHGQINFLVREYSLSICSFLRMY